MQTLSLDLSKLREICRQNDIALLGVFGSVARGEATEASDIDLLVRFSKPKSLLTLVAIEQQMSDALHKQVDLVTEAALSPYLRDRVLRELRVVYEAR